MGPIVQWLGHLVFIQVTRVRFPIGSHFMSDPERQRKWMIPHRILHDVVFFSLCSSVFDWKISAGLVVFFD